MSLKKKSQYAALSAAARKRLEPYRDLMGKRPDGEIARLAGLDRRYVVVFRHHEGIGPYRRGSAEKSEATATATEGKRFRKSKLDAFRHLMGEVPDGQVAELAGCSREAVMRYRSRHGIAPASRARKATEATLAIDPTVPVGGATPAKTGPAPEIELSASHPAEAPEESNTHAAAEPPLDSLPPEADDVFAAEPRAPSRQPSTPAADPLGGAEGFMVTVQDGAVQQVYLVLGDDLALAAQKALDTFAGHAPNARILELRYFADVL